MMHNNGKGWYEHDTAENMTKLVARVKAGARRNTNENVYKVLQSPNSVSTTDDARAKAQATLFDIITAEISNPSLIQTLMQSYDDNVVS